AETQDFLDVQALLESSLPKQRVAWFGYAMGGLLLIALASAYVTTQSPQLEGVVDQVSKLAFLAIMGAMAGLMAWTVRRQRAEMKRIESLEEFVQLRNWPEAAASAQQILSQ